MRTRLRQWWAKATSEPDHREQDLDDATFWINAMQKLTSFIFK